MIHLEKRLEINVHITRALRNSGRNDTPSNYLAMLYDLKRRWGNDRTITAEKQDWLDALEDEIKFYEGLL